MGALSHSLCQITVSSSELSTELSSDENKPLPVERIRCFLIQFTRV